MTTLIYDLEIKNAIIGPGETAQAGITYCQGFDDHANMGISVIGTLALSPQGFTPRIYFAQDLSEFVDWVSRHVTLLIGYNNIRFDDPVIEATHPGYLAATAHIKRYDILQEIWKAEGHPLIDDHYDKHVHGGYNLDHMAQANGQGGKTGHGAQAPIDWQQGHHARVINYCLNDVMLTAELWANIVDGTLKAPAAKGGHLINCPLPTDH